MFYILGIYLRYFIANPRMKKIIIWLAMLILVKSVVSTLEITEVMYDFLGDDNNHEFIEIYSYPPVNISGFIIGDSSSNDTLNMLQFYPGEYSLIVEGGFNYSGLNASIYSAGKTIGDNLNNDHDAIYFYYPTGTLIDFVFYNSSMGANGNNKTLEKNQEGVWKESLIGRGTPGKENSVREISSEQAGNNNESDEINQEEFSPDGVNATLSAISCDIDLQIKVLNHALVYENGQSLKFKPVLNNKSFPFMIEYWIEDLFGKAVKNQLNTTNTNQKSWKANIEEEDRVLFIKAVVHPGCNDTNETNNIAEEMVVVKKNSEEIYSSSTAEGNSTLNITEIKPPNVHFGGVIMADIEAYKGSTNKYSLSAWVEKEGKIISEKTKFHLKNKNTRYETSLPVQIKPNCNAKIEDGTATLIAEGLGLRAEKELLLTGINAEVCQEYNRGTEKQENNEVKEDKEKKKNVFTILDLPAEIHPGEAVRVKVQAQSKDDAEYKVWSYLYRGSKCYSCSSGSREENALSFSVDENEAEAVGMLVKVDENIEDGEYNLMVKYQKNDQKTVKSTTQKIHVKKLAEEKSLNQTVPLWSSSDDSGPILISEKAQKKEIQGYSGLVVYESNSARSKNIIPYVLFAAFGLLSAVLAISKRNT